MSEITFSGFGYVELEEAARLLNAYVENTPDDFYGALSMGFDPSNAHVYIVDGASNKYAMNGDELQQWFSTPYDGHEGFAEDLKEMFMDCPEDFVREDVEYLFDKDILTSNDDHPDEPREEEEVFYEGHEIYEFLTDRDQNHWNFEEFCTRFTIGDEEWPIYFEWIVQSEHKDTFWNPEVIHKIVTNVRKLSTDGNIYEDDLITDFGIIRRQISLYNKWCNFKRG